MVHRGIEYGTGDMDTDDILDGIFNLFLKNNTAVPNTSRESRQHSNDGTEAMNFLCRSVATRQMNYRSGESHGVGSRLEGRVDPGLFRG